MDIFPPAKQRPALKIHLERVPPLLPCPLRGARNRSLEGPECSAARWLFDNGLASREDALQTYRGAQRCMSGSVGWFADRRVKQDDRDGTPRFARWHPHPFASSPRTGRKPAFEEVGCRMPAEAESRSWDAYALSYSLPSPPPRASSRLPRPGRGYAPRQ